MLGQRAEHDGLAAVQAQLDAVAAVVLMDLQLAEAHGCPAELTQDGALLAFPGLVKRQHALLHALLAHGAPDLHRERRWSQHLPGSVRPQAPDQLSLGAQPRVQ